MSDLFNLLEQTDSLGAGIDIESLSLIILLLHVLMPKCAFVAQSVEHHHGKVGVSGSNPLEGSK